MKKLTARQQQVLELIQQSLAAHRSTPTRAEIATALGIRSANAAEDHLRALVKKGYIRLNTGRNRNIELLDELPETAPSEPPPPQLPLIGQVAAGAPILAIEHIERYLPCPLTGFRQPPDYLLRVRGDSMRDACIHDGDLLLVHHTRQLSDGAVMVVRLDDEVTVKRISIVPKNTQEKRQLWLLPANDQYRPTRVDTQQVEFTAEGLVVGVLRAL